MKYVYPAIFKEEDGSILVDVPDLRHIHTFGEDLAEAIFMATDAISIWLDDAERSGIPIPKPTPIEDIDSDADALVSMVACDTDRYRRETSTKSVIKSVSIPEWLDFRARKADAPLSSILQQALKEYLHIAD